MPSFLHYPLKVNCRSKTVVGAPISSPDKRGKGSCPVSVRGKLYPAWHSLHIPLHKWHSDSRQAIIQGRWGFSQSHFWKSHNLKSHSVPGKPRQLVTWWHDYIPRQERLEEYVSCWTKNSVKMGFVPKKGRRNGQASNIWKCDRHEEATSHAFCNSQWSRFWGISIPEMIKKRRPLRRLKRGI